MDLKDKLLSYFLILEDQVNVNTQVHSIRSEALKRFEKKGFPTKNMEAWKYTSLRRWLNNDFSLSIPKQSNTLEYRDMKNFTLHEIDSYKIVFVDGIYNSHLSRTSHEGHDICVMGAALEQPKYKKIINKYFSKIASKEEEMTSLNTAFAKEGAYIIIPKNHITPKPIQVIYIATDNSTPYMLQPRNLIVLEEGAQVQIIERHQSLSSQKVLTNNVTEIYLKKQAQLNYYKVQDDNIENSCLIDNTYIHQEEKSNANVHTFSFGGNLIRNNLNFIQKGSFLNSSLKGITIIGNQQHIDHYTMVHHKNPDNQSHQDYKGIYTDKSTGVFNGKIIVDKIAQRTNAFQQNNNMLLENKATVNTKPQLEIFADDVKCSHGCTIGQIDENVLFYLQSRGISKKDAKAIIMFAFTNDILEDIKITELKNRITKLIADKIGVNIGFTL